MWNVDFMDKVLILKLVRDLNFCVEIIENIEYILEGNLLEKV